jgi:hypothetical protein
MTSSPKVVGGARSSNKIAIEMAFKCPSCLGNKLKIDLGLQLWPGDVDEEHVQTVKCEGCGFRGIAVYRESRRGSLKSESVWHDGFEVSDKDMEFMLNGIQRCPSPRDRHCQCETHLAWRKFNWVAPQHSGMTVKRQFRMNLVH